MIVLARADGLDRATYRQIADAGEPVTVAPALLEAVDAARARLLAHLDTGVAAYGVTTGLGHLAKAPIDPAERPAFQRALLLRGAGHGPPLEPAVVRGAMLLRLCGFLRGGAGVSAALCALLVDRLNDGWSPWVPSRGIDGAGEVVALSHLFQTFVGAGHVLEQGERTDADAALARRGCAPFAPGLKEGLALINGAPLAPALAARRCDRLRGLLAHATLAGALAAAVTGAGLRPYAPRIGALKGDPAQAAVHAELAALLAGADPGDPGQAPVSFRVLPQVHGAALAVLEHVDAQVDRELRAVTDSPLFLDAEGEEPAGLYPSGNFHAQALALGLDALAIAVAHLGNLSEKRLHRLLDGRFSGLPDQLATRPGRETGLVVVHKAAIGLVAENRTLAAPAGVHATDASSGQEDFQAFAFLAGEQLGRALDNLELVLAGELVALRQARHLAGRPLPPHLETVADRLAAVVEPVGPDRPLSGDVERVRALVAEGALLAG